MKKLILMMLLVVGGVMSASAAKLYVNTSNISWWTNVRIYAYNSDSDNNGWTYNADGVVASTSTFLGKNWYVYDMGDYTNAIVQYFESSNHNITNESWSITNINNDRFVLLSNEQDSDKKWKYYEDGYAFRSNVLDNWGATTCNMTVVDNNTLSYTLTKSVVDASGVDKIWFRILNQEGQLYPKSNGLTLALGTSISEYYNNWDATGWSFGINKPNFDYEKIVVTASLSGTTWTISADAYISKTVSGTNQYATFGSKDSQPFNLAALAGTNVKAYTVTANASTGKLTLVEKNDALAAGEGVLLENLTGSDITVSLPVAASATASSSNGLVAYTGGDARLTQPGGNDTYYILSKDANDEVGFFKVNTTSGNKMGTNTAYLKVTSTSGARQAFYFDNNETTAIMGVEVNNEIKGAYNLNGQRVAQPTKGLYIVNGKKVIMK